MAIIRKLIIFAIIIFIIPVLAGCWNYRGLDELETVVGLAIDKGSKEGTYKLTFEAVDLKKAGGSEIEYSAKQIESEGTTIFEAIRKAKNMLANKLFFGHMQILIISKQIAQEGVSSIFSFFMHDLEPRETIYVVVSGEETASALFEADPFSSDFVSTEISAIIDEDEKVFANIIAVPFYKIFNAFHCPGIEVALPVFNLIRDGGTKTICANGSAIFKDDKLIGFITPEDTQYLLYAKDEVGGGIIAVDYNNDGQNDISLEIKASKTKASLSFDGSRIKIKLDVQTKVALGETPKNMETSSAEVYKKIESQAQKKLADGITKSFERVRRYKSDVYGFGFMLYKKNLKLWNKLKDNWESYYRNAKIEVNSKVIIINTGKSL